MTPEERIKAAAEALKKEHTLLTNEEVVRLIAPILNPEDFPPKPKPKSKWPSAETMRILSIGRDLGHDDAWRAQVHNALLADPIIKEAVACRDEWEKGDGWRNQYPKIVDAVNEAGL